MFVEVKSLYTNPKLYELSCYARFPLTQPGQFSGLAAPDFSLVGHAWLGRILGLANIWICLLHSYNAIALAAIGLARYCHLVSCRTSIFGGKAE